MFILGGQRIDQKSKKLVERQSEMRKGRKERFEKGSRESFVVKRETKRQFEEKEGLRDSTFIELSRSYPAM